MMSVSQLNSNSTVHANTAQERSVMCSDICQDAWYKLLVVMNLKASQQFRLQSVCLSGLMLCAVLLLPRLQLVQLIE
jgi:hypothetical protein